MPNASGTPVHEAAAGVSCGSVRRVSTPARRLLPVAAAGAVGLAAAIVIAVLTGTGYVGALAGVLVLLVLADLAYTWRSNRRRAAADARTAAALARAADAAAARHAEVLAAVARIEQVEADLRRDLVEVSHTAELAVVKIRTAESPL